MKNYKVASTIFWIFITVLPVLGIIFTLLDPQSFDQARELWQSRIIQFGVLAPLAFILLQALQVVLTPISHYAVGVVGGFLYGPYLGALLNWVGRMIGHIAAFLIARYAGRKVADRFVKKETLDKYDKYVSDKSFLLFLFYFLPVFPDDEMSYLAGLSKMDFKTFLVVNIFGHIGGSLGLAYIGSGINTKDPLFWILFVASVLGFVLIYLKMRKEKINELT
jgi:uncharacterized membrane protein YdjX (TVP38/TMEM64 family)